MKISHLRSFFAAALLCAAGAVMANDFQIAPKLVGNWEGEWQYSGKAGKLTSKVSAAEGNQLKGQATWFGTAVGDLELEFNSASVKDGVLTVEHPYDMSFKAKIAEDGKSMTGTWESRAGSGPLLLKKIN